MSPELESLYQLCLKINPSQFRDIGSDENRIIAEATALVDRLQDENETLRDQLSDTGYINPI